MKWALLLLCLIPGLSAAEEPQQFHLCSPFIEQVNIGEQAPSGWPVFVKLTVTGSRSFEAFTQAHIGQQARIQAGDLTLSRATITATVSDGVLRQTFRSREMASSWQRMLSEELPSAPCGPLR